MRTLAMAAFLGSSAMTGMGFMLLWGLALQQSVALVLIGPPLMLLSGGIALGTPREGLDNQMRENRRNLRLSRPQIRRPLGPVRLRLRASELGEKTT